MIIPYVNPLLPLDQCKDTPSKAAYSLRRLKSGYKDSAIRVRRSSDNAELDIPFCGTNICLSTLIAFVTTNSAYVVTWYDQSGNGNHVTQATAGNQPRIVNSGVIDRDFDYTKAGALYPTFASASGVNIVTNASAFVATTGWTTGTGVLSVSGGNLLLTGNASSATCSSSFATAVSVTIGKRYYVRVTMRVTNSNATQMTIELDGSTAGTNVTSIQLSPTQNQWYTMGAILTVGADFTGNVSVVLRHNYADAATQNGKVLEIQDVVCIDVTDLGQPTINFDGAASPNNDILSLTPADGTSLDISGYPFMFNAVFSDLGTASANPYIIAKNTSDATTNLQYSYQYNITTDSVVTGIENSTTRQVTANSSVLPNIQYITSATAVSGSQKGYVNGTNSGTDGNYAGAITSGLGDYFNIGARSNNAGNTAWLGAVKGNISEIIILSGTTSRSKIERNQSKYYGINVA